VANETHTLGRLPHKPDPRDLDYPMSAVVKRTTQTYKYWSENQWWGDQGNYPACVAYGGLHILSDGPISQNPDPKYDPMTLFHDIGGTAAGAYVRDLYKTFKVRGVITNYWWAQTMTDLKNGIFQAPIGFGVPWFDSMFDAPDEAEPITISGDQAGGHFFDVNGYNRTKGLWRCKNSWGRDWGYNGHFYLTDAQVNYLVFQLDGEAVLGTEVKPI
jgi:Papain family cysteine protease